MNADEFTTFSDSEEEETGGPSREASPAPLFHSVGDFPLEQSHDDTLRWVFEQVIKIHDHTVHPDTVLIKDRLFWLSCDTCTEEEYTQLLVPNSRQEMIFPAAHYNAWQGLWDVGYEKILE